MQKCTRCGHTMGKNHDGWVKCSKCGLSKFVGQKPIKNDAENKTQPLPSPTENQPKKVTSKAK